MHHVPIDTQHKRDGLSTLVWAVLSAMFSCVAAAAPKFFGHGQSHTR